MSVPKLSAFNTNTQAALGELLVVLAAVGVGLVATAAAAAGAAIAAVSVLVESDAVAGFASPLPALFSAGAPAEPPRKSVTYQPDPLS